MSCLGINRCSSAAGLLDNVHAMCQATMSLNRCSLVMGADQAPASLMNMGLATMSLNQCLFPSKCRQMRNEAEVAKVPLQRCPCAPDQLEPV